MKAQCSYWPILPTGPAAEKLDDDSGTVDCLCGVNFDDGKGMVHCDECDIWVHTRCALFIKGEPSFVCHKCKATVEKSIQEEQQSRLAYWRELDAMIWANLAKTWVTFAKTGVVLPPLHTVQETIPKLHIQELRNQFEEEQVLDPKDNKQELIKNQKEREELLEEVVPKRKKHKSNRRKKTPPLMKVGLRLKHTKKRKEKLSSQLKLTTPRLKRTTNKRRTKNKASMKTGARRGLDKSVNNKKKESVLIEGRMKNNKRKNQNSSQMGTKQ